MFKDDELNEYAKMFAEIGIIEVNEQVKVLEFLYTLGTIVNEC